MKRLGKGGSFFVPLVIFGAIVTLISILGILYLKADRLEGTGSEAIGEKQVKLLTAYQVGEKYLHFVDESVKLSIRPALLEISGNGLKKEPNCGKDSNQQYTLWFKDSTNSDCNIVPTPCYPSKYDAESYFNDSFKSEYSALLQEFNGKKKSPSDFSANIPKEFAALKTEDAGSELELVGTAKDPIAIERFTGKAMYSLVTNYSVKPSFRVGIDANFLKEGAEIAGKAPQLLRKSDSEIRSILGSFNSQNPGLKWNLASYTTPPTSCQHTIGTCDYCDEYQDVCVACEDNPCCRVVRVCVRSHQGKLVEVVSYDNVYAAFSVANGKSFYVSDPPSNPPQLKNVAYNFGLNWLEETGRSTRCDP